MELPFLHDIVIIFGLSIAILFICHKLKLPAIVGFLITGILAGPHGFRLIDGVHEVEILAEIGVVLLLFTIGIEFSFTNLLQIKKSVILGGSLQVLFTIAATFLIIKQIGWSSSQALFIGFLISLSSTAIVLKLLQERGEMDSPHGRTCLGILIFQDIAVVPMLLFTPLLAGATGDIGKTLLILTAKGIGVILFVIVSANWVVPEILFQVAKVRSRELFLLSIVAMCFAIAWLTSSMGLSLALGAFLAGLIISESEYSHQAFGNVLPFRDIFTSLFFVSIGMLLDARLLLEKPLLILVLVVTIIIVKAIMAALAVASLGFPLRTMVKGGLALSQIAEFSFVVSKVGLSYKLIDSNTYQLFLAVSIVTMILSPFVMASSPRVAEKLSTLPLLNRLHSGIFLKETTLIPNQKENLKDHLIIIGFGVNGRNLARAAKVAGIAYIAIEMNADTVKEEQKNGVPIYYGDAIQENVLEHAGILEARVLVIAISDPVATRHITATARHLNPKIHIIARTRLIQEIKPLYELGAAEVIPEEFETSVEIFTRVLVKYLIPRNEIEKFIAEVRSDGYEMLRSLSRSSATLSDLKLHLSDLEISTLTVEKTSPLADKTLGKLKLRKSYNVAVLAIRRGEEMLYNPDGDTKILTNDVLIVLGQPEKISNVLNNIYLEE